MTKMGKSLAVLILTNKSNHWDLFAFKHAIPYFVNPQFQVAVNISLSLWRQILEISIKSPENLDKVERNRDNNFHFSNLNW